MRLSKGEISEIYERYVNVNYTAEYANKYVPLSFKLNNKLWRWENKDFPRVIALLDFREYMLKYNREFNSVLTFNGSVDPELEYMNYEHLYDYNYDDNLKYDLHCLDLGKNDFDFAMINQTIEHLYDPILALRNIKGHMVNGGMFYANVPCDNVPHDIPYHFYTGLTPVGLGVIVKLAGFDILEIGQWGNKTYFKQMYDNLWSDYTYDANPGYNDINCPLITWCLAIKNN